MYLNSRTFPSVCNVTVMEEAMAQAGVVLPASKLATLIPSPETSKSRENPATKRQRGAAHTGPLAPDQWAALVDNYERLEGGLSNPDLIQGVMYYAEEDVRGMIDNKALGKFYLSYKAMPATSQAVVIRSIALFRKPKLIVIPVETGLKGLAEVLFPRTDKQWADGWLQSGSNDTRIGKRMSRAIADYKKFEQEKQSRIEAVKAEEMLAQQIAQAIAELDLALADGRILQEDYTAQCDAIRNPKKADASPKPINSIRGIFIALFKIATQEQKDFLVSGFRANNFDNDTVNKWIAESNK